MRIVLVLRFDDLYTFEYYKYEELYHVQMFQYKYSPNKMMRNINHVL